MHALVLLEARRRLPPLALHLIADRDEHLRQRVLHVVVLAAAHPVDALDVAVLHIAHAARAREVVHFAFGERGRRWVEGSVGAARELAHPELRVLLAGQGDGLRRMVHGQGAVVDKLDGRRQLERRHRAPPAAVGRIGLVLARHHHNAPVAHLFATRLGAEVSLAQPQQVQHAVRAAQRHRALETFGRALELLLRAAALLHVVGAIAVEPDLEDLRVVVDPAGRAQPLVRHRLAHDVVVAAFATAVVHERLEARVLSVRRHEGGVGLDQPVRVREQRHRFVDLEAVSYTHLRAHETLMNL
eukprot:6485742-Prymnesium_polylepis.1